MTSLRTASLALLIGCEGQLAGSLSDTGPSARDGGSMRDDAGETARRDAAGRDASHADDASAIPGTDAGAPVAIDGGPLPDAGDARTYSTTFDGDENPISEGGAWTATARPWLRVRTSGGIARPDEYVSGYNDNYALLSGFGPDVEITATIFIAGAAEHGEILLLARMHDTADSIRGYEFLYDGDGSVQLMRWNGGHGDFTPMGGEGTSPGRLEDFDQIRMRVAGSTITVFHRRPPADWVEIGRTSDTSFGDGQPGFGFFVRDLGPSIEEVGLRDFTVTEIL
jgi:hypothetical protein